MRLYITYNPIRLKRLSIVAVLSMILSLIGFFDASAQNVYGWDKEYGGSGNDEARAIVEMEDRGLILTGSSNSFGNSREIYTIRTDVDGTVLWTHIEGTGGNDDGMDLTIASDQKGVVVLGNGENLINGGKDVIFFKLDNKGNKVWTKYFSTDADDEAFGITTTIDGGYIITGYTEDAAGSKDLFLLKVDENGTEEWLQTFGGDNDDAGHAVVQTPNGNITVTGYTESSAGDRDIFVVQTNDLGFSLFEKVHGSAVGDFDQGNDLVIDSDGNIFVTGETTNQGQAALLKLSNTGDFVFLLGFGGTLGESGDGIVLTDDGNLVIAGFTEPSGFNINYFLLKVNPEGGLIWDKSIGQDQFFEFGNGLVKTYDGGFAVAGTRSGFASGSYYLVRTNANGELLTNHIIGVAFRDANTDCNFQGSEEGVRNWIVEAKGANRTFYGSVDANGNFDVRTDTGSYELNIISPNVYWDINNCQGINFPIDVETFDTIYIDYPIQTEIVCPVMEVDVATARIIPCEDNVYRVDYCNQGTQIAVGAEVELILEKNLIYNSSVLPPVMIDDSLYVFAIGNIDIGECGFFEINVTADCNTTITNEAHCVKASITPNETCLAPNPSWDESSVRVDSWCEGDSVIFLLKNEGDQPMLQSTKYYIVEDVILMFGGQPQDSELLPTGGTQRIAIPANGKHYRLVADQSPNHPGRNYFATASVEACDPDMVGSSLGFVNQLEEDDRDPYQSKDCIENQLSFDKIDFKGYPKGYLDTCDTNADLITSQTDLKYHIRFQNVTTDTSNRVVIRDTIPSGLDITTLRPGASSHPYTFEAYGDGFVKFTFSDLEQVDSTANEMLSHGFVKYRISQKPNNPVGTIIENGAIVFQDYDAPEETDRVKHQVGGTDLTDFLCFLTSVVNPDFPNVELEVYPNPFTEFATIKIKGQQFQNLEFHLFDATGREIRTETIENNTLEFNRNQLSQGLYIFTINVKGQAVANGKLIIQ